MKLFIDIETLPSGAMPSDEEMIQHVPGNMSKPESIQAWIESNRTKVYRKRALNPYDGKILCIGYKLGDEPTEIIMNDDEDIVLARFNNLILEQADKAYSMSWYAYNIDFDLRWLFLRGLKNQLPFVKILPIFDRYDKRKHDPMKILAMGDKDKYVGLDKVCSFLGLPLKGDIDGSLVYDYYKEGRLEEIATYCKADVDKVYTIVNRLGI